MFGFRLQLSFVAVDSPLYGILRLINMNKGPIDLLPLTSCRCRHVVFIGSFHRQRFNDKSYGFHGLPAQI